MCQIQTRRSDVVAEARTWLYTPFIRRAMIKGAGVDCGLLAYAVYRVFDLVPEFEAEWLEYDWFAHTTQERYLVMIQRYLKKLVTAQARSDFLPEFLPGNMVLAKLSGSLVFNHAGIISCWPKVIHAGLEIVHEVDAHTDPIWANREIVVYDIGLEC